MCKFIKLDKKGSVSSEPFFSDAVIMHNIFLFFGFNPLFQPRHRLQLPFRRYRHI